jgi:hypothetical protein
MIIPTHLSWKERCMKQLTPVRLPSAWIGARDSVPTFEQDPSWVTHASQLIGSSLRQEASRGGPFPSLKALETTVSQKRQISGV